MNKVAVIDYGMGNFEFVTKAIEYVGRELGEKPKLLPPTLKTYPGCDRIVFPELVLSVIAWLKLNAWNR